MAYEFKKLSDVNSIEGMKENLNVLVEDSGEIVKIAANNMIPEDYIPAPATAEVGQVIAVKAVDENGKPTEWEAISTEKYQIAFVDNAGTYSCPSHTYEEIHNMFTKTMNKISAILITTPNYDGTPHIAVLQNFEVRRVVHAEGSCYRFSFRDSFEDTTICLEIEPNGTVTELK